MNSTDDGSEQQLSLRESRVSWRRVEGEIVALDLGDEHYVSINGSGTKLWERLQGGCTRPELVDTLVEAYGIDAAAASTDVDAFLTMLEGRELLEHGAP